MRLRWPSILLIAIITVLFIVFNIYGFLELLRFFRLRQEKKLIEWQSLHNPPLETSTYNREIFSNDINEEEEEVKEEVVEEETVKYRDDLENKRKEVETTTESPPPPTTTPYTTTSTPSSTTTTTQSSTTFSTTSIRITSPHTVGSTRRPYNWHWSPSKSSSTTVTQPSTTTTTIPTTTPTTTTATITAETTTTEQITRPIWTTTRRTHIGSYREHGGLRIHHEKSTTEPTTTSTTTRATTPSTTTSTAATTTTLPSTQTPFATTTRIRVTTDRYLYQRPSSTSDSSPFERITIPSSSSYRTPYVHRFETSSSSSSSLPTPSSTSRGSVRGYWVPGETRTSTTTPLRHHHHQHQQHHHHHHNRTHIDVHAHIRPHHQYPPPHQLPNVVYPSVPQSTTTEETTTTTTTVRPTTTSTVTIPETDATTHHTHNHHHHHNNHNHTHIQHVHSTHHQHPHQHHQHQHISTTTQQAEVITETKESTTIEEKDIEDIEIEAIGDIVSSTIAERTEQPRQRQRQPEPPVPGVKSEERDATLVIGFLDIGRGDWFQYRRPLEKYHEFMENILALDNYIVVFTDNSTSEFVRKYRKNMGLIHKTVVHEISLQDLPLYGYINEARRIIDDELKNETFYTHVGDRDMRTHPEAISAEYNIVVNSKTHFLHNVTMDNPFNTDHFIWLDAGYGHGNENYFPYNNMWRPKFPDGKISLIKVTPDHDVLSTYNLEKLYRKNWAVLSGGFIAGDKHSIGQLHSIVHRKFIQLIYQNYVDDDQTLLVLAVNAYPHLFHIVQGDWFDAFRLFSVDPEVQLG